MIASCLKLLLRVDSWRHVSGYRARQAITASRVNVEVRAQRIDRKCTARETGIVHVGRGLGRQQSRGPVASAIARPQMY